MKPHLAISTNLHPAVGDLAPDEFEHDLTQFEFDFAYVQNLPGQELDRPCTFLRNAARILAALFATRREDLYLARRTGADPVTVRQAHAIARAGAAELIQIFKQATSAPAAPAEKPSEISSKSPVISNISSNFPSSIS